MGRWKLLEFFNPDQEVSKQAVTKGSHFIPKPASHFSPSLSTINPPFLRDCPCHGYPPMERYTLVVSKLHAKPVVLRSIPTKSFGIISKTKRCGRRPFRYLQTLAGFTLPSRLSEQACNLWPARKRQTRFEVGPSNSPRYKGQ